MISPLSGLDAVNSITSEAKPGIGNTQAASGDFAAVLGQAMQNVAQSVQTAETVSMEAMKGQADVREVVDAVMAAERQMTAATAIRDKITTAYLEISRMAI
ncbi:MAG: flagellar hook-basal body complex protein FliE [Pseudomonadota bacterium]